MPSMSRALFSWFCLLLVFFGMGVAGYSVAAMEEGPDQAETVGGWCCLVPGGDCDERVNLVACEQDDGILFDTSRRTCNSVCGSSS